MAFSLTGLSLILGLVLFFVLTVIRRSRNAIRPPLPPGPKGRPLVGNMNDLPKPGVLESHHWLKHKDSYGPISSVTVMGQTLIILNESRLAFELMEKRSAIHSSRPRQVFAGEMVGWRNSLGLSPYSNRFRTYRKNMAHIIGSKSAASQFDALQEAEVGRFLLRVLGQPLDIIEHIRKEAGSVILKIAYGYNTEPHKNDPLVDMAGDAMNKFAEAGVPGAFLVDLLPWLKNIPDWVPGTEFKQKARDWAAALNDVVEKPYAFVKRQMAQEKHEPSFLSQLLDQEKDSDPQTQFTNKWSAMSLYAAGADTTVSSIAAFFLAMAISPTVQQKAQEEIDRVIGQDRLPVSEDRKNLPYIEATVKEVLRWHSVAPMGLPHTSTEDDVYEGYFIPREAMIMANVWHFTHDPSVYSDPMAFRPDRFLGPNPEPDPHRLVFGFGRRICPGRILADNALYLNVAQSLAVFNVSKGIGVNGRPIEALLKAEPGVVSHPAPFECSIKPRSQHHKELIRSIENTYPWPRSDAELLDSL